MCESIHLRAIHHPGSMQRIEEQRVFSAEPSSLSETTREQDALYAPTCPMLIRFAPN